jgi:minor extracellular serine protease Vpr
MSLQPLRPIRISVALACAALLVVSATLPAAGRSPAGAAANTPATPAYVAAGHHRFEHIDVANIDPQLLPYWLDPTRKVTVMVQLADPPVAVHQAAALAAGAELSDGERAVLRAQIKSQQDDLRARIRRLGGRILGQYQDAYNGLRVRLPLRGVRAVAALPGVARVMAIPLRSRSDVTGTAYVAAPAAWSVAAGVGGLTGKGVKIAIIDSGIDYYHADFGGSGDPADYQADDGLSAQTPAFPNAKVIGGWDFAGDNYDPSSSGDEALPHPDPDPLDCDGHGTHVAGIAAGYGVLADGHTYRGPYTADTLKQQSFLVGPGVAPEAQIYALRIFGCSGPTDLVLDAIDWAVKHDADVINLSLGSPFGQADEPDAVAADNAAKAGIVVVASSGNEGPRAYMTGAPAAATRVISVGSVDANASFPGARIVFAAPAASSPVPASPSVASPAPGLSPTPASPTPTSPSPTPGPIVALNANNSDALPVTGPLRVLRDESGGIALGCDPDEYAAVEPGEIVVTVRGVCARTDRVEHGQAAGAAAVIMVNNAEDGSFPPFEDVIPGVSIPFLGVQAGAGEALSAADGMTVTVDPGAPLSNPAYRHLSDYSSAGPRTGDGALKPDILAPGDGVKSAGVGLGTGGVRFSGTSMAAPFVAGAAALVRQAHPAWSPEQVKAALMNTAQASGSRLVAAGAGADPRGAGAGVLQVARAVTARAYATTGPGQASLSFGYREISGAYSDTKSIRIRNTSRSAVTYRLAASFAGPSRGARITVSPSRVTVPGGATRVVKVTLSLSEGAARALPAIDLAADATADLTYLAGAVTATPTRAAAGMYDLRVPFLLVPRPLSAISAGPRSAYTQEGPILGAQVQLANAGLHAGAADVYAWGLSDPREGSSSADLRAVGVQAFASTGQEDVIPPGDYLLVFAVNSWNSWSNASVNEFDIAIDTAEPGMYDYVLAVLDHGLVTAGEYDGRPAGFVFRMSDGALIDAFFAEAPMDSSTLYVGVLASDLGLLDGPSSRFQYAASGVSLQDAVLDEVVGRAGFDPVRPALSTGDYIELAPGDEAGLSVAINLPEYRAQPNLGWLVLGLDNRSGPDQAATVPLGPLPPLQLP